jgi:hypothetical protein
MSINKQSTLGGIYIGKPLKATIASLAVATLGN